MVIDGGDAITGRQAVENIRTLGFDPATIKVLVNSHQHFDHAAGLAELKKAAPGAKLYVSAPRRPDHRGRRQGRPLPQGAAVGVRAHQGRRDPEGRPAHPPGRRHADRPHHPRPHQGLHHLDLPGDRRRQGAPGAGPLLVERPAGLPPGGAGDLSGHGGGL
ncbi:MBL fold metallo-hydrolase [Phenylobacterium sp. J367]|uniref:MBL fold metallo-hydrolase n=1 Tax=Phenylobacterium sp. J367 TaxID=2898435 RepID=UPI0035B49D7F